MGTRPEAIKLAPLILQFRQHADIRCEVCSTGQHREMLASVLDTFDLAPDVDLNLMAPNQTLPDLTAKAVIKVSEYLQASSPHMVLVQGDTTTAFCASLAAFYSRVPVGHVEAGLRTYDRHAPWPEEMNRTLVSRIAEIHFAPTESSRAALVKEGISSDSIHTTGNTVVDALLYTIGRLQGVTHRVPGLPDDFLTRPSHYILITGHRRENFGPGFEQICKAIRGLALRYKTLAFVYPVHLNPNVREPVYRLLSGIPNVHLLPPASYLDFVALMKSCHLILTDSGGIQEEAPSLGKPVLIMRTTTERPEAVEAGAAKLVGTDGEDIEREVSHLLEDPAAYVAMTGHSNPFGDGHASERIATLCESFLNAYGLRSLKGVQRL